jgi:hypothetical protein
VIECLASKLKALGSNPTTAKKTKVSELYKLSDLKISVTTPVFPI